ncbi:MAG: tyrosine-type recombinase/integrase [Frankiales bacterium]|nr:tyrosine-type recombinase/integrase [Frankiales bacterium]
MQAEFIAKAFLAGYDARTRESYATDLRQYFTWCATVPLNPLSASRAHVQVFAKVLEEQLGRSKSTIARKLSSIAGFYAYAVTEGVLDRSPVAHVRRPRVSDESPRFGLDRHELAGLLTVASDAGPVAYALVCLLALNGLRISEACNATVDDLSEERGHRLLTVTRKGGKKARVPLAPRTADAIAALPSLSSSRAADNTSAGSGSEPQSPQLAAGGSLLGLDRFAGWRLIRRLVHHAGISKVISPHSLRHTFVTLALDAGVELRDVQDAAGHADPRTTRRYDRGRHSLDRAATYRVAAYIDVDEQDH